MKALACLFFILALVLEKVFCQEQREKFTVTVVNTLQEDRENVLVVIPEAKIQSVIKDFNKIGFSVFDGKKEIPSQYNESDPISKGIVLVVERLGKGEKKQLEVRFDGKAKLTHEYAKRTQAELAHKTGGAWKNGEYKGGEFKNVSFLSVPPEQTDHSAFIRYEGPGWESDKVAYRFYLDERNAVDVFGKKITDPVLQQIGTKNAGSYHEMQSWGMDIMKVGKSLGLGTMASVVNGAGIRVGPTDSLSCRILENGPVYSSLQTNYYGWKVHGSNYDIKAVTSIHAGSRLSCQHVNISNDIYNLSTGIVKDSLAPVLSSRGDASSFGYLATYGKQSLNGDELGLVVFFDPSNFQSFITDEYSHIVKLSPKSQTLKYYFAAAWIQEPGGIRSKAEFERFVQHISRELANPVLVQMSN